MKETEHLVFDSLFADLEEAAAVAELAEMGIYPRGKEIAEAAIAYCVREGFSWENN
jgi:hypothetical protein